MEQNFKIGDTVQLNSGSPMMTIVNINNDIIECTWFDGKINISNEFNINTIQPSSYASLSAISV